MNLKEREAGETPTKQLILTHSTTQFPFPDRADFFFDILPASFHEYKIHIITQIYVILKNGWVMLFILLSEALIAFSTSVCIH